LNNQIQVIDLLNEDEILKYSGHLNSRYLVDVKIHENKYNNKKYLISGSEDDTIAIWDVERGGECNKINISGMSDTNQIINCLSVNDENIIAYSGFPDIDNSISLLSIKIS
jgi:WD40 repeat protein